MSKSNGTLVRTDLSAEDWRDIRKLALDKNVPVRRLAGDALRALLKGGKP